MSNKPDTSRPFLKYQGAKILSDGPSETVVSGFDQDQRHMTSQFVSDDPINDPTLDGTKTDKSTGRKKGTMVPKFCPYLALVSRQTTGRSIDRELKK
jgi:hypothetical protein